MRTSERFVMLRTATWFLIAGYVGAVLLLVLSTVVAARGPAFSIAVGVVGAAFAFFIGYHGSRLLDQRSRQITEAIANSELISSQLSTERHAVDNLAEGLEVALFICDAKGLIVYANRRASDLFDFEDIRGRPILAVTLSHELERIALEVQRTNLPLRSEVSFSVPKERVGLVKAWMNQEDPGRVFLSIYDITELRRLERIRQDFVSNVSHELRTPMTVIRTMAETLLDDAEPGTQIEKYLKKTIEEVDRLSNMSQDLLILSAAESNPVRKNRCDLAEVFRSTTHQLEPAAKSKGLILRYEGDPECVIAANTAQMVQVAVNLVQNAINYTNQGQVVVRVSCDAENAEASVEDTGIGIASEYLPRIFERFYRIDKGRSRSTGGTGLGLSIAKHIVEAHGGTLRVESALNRGSTFFVSLPIS